MPDMLIYDEFIIQASSGTQCILQIYLYQPHWHSSVHLAWQVILVNSIDQYIFGIAICQSMFGQKSSKYKALENTYENMEKTTINFDQASCLTYVKPARGLKKNNPAWFLERYTMNATV